MSDCLFCNIISGKIAANIVCENEYALAFRDINPQAKTHILVVPKKHIASLDAVGKDDGRIILEIHLMLKEIARLENIAASGYRVTVNCGADAGQAVGHLHYHIMGGRKLGWPPG